MTNGFPIIKVKKDTKISIQKYSSKKFLQKSANTNLSTNPYITTTATDKSTIEISNNTIIQYTSPVIFQNINKEITNSNTIQDISTTTFHNNENKQLPMDLNKTDKISDSDSNKKLASPPDILNNNIIHQQLTINMDEVYNRAK